MGGACYSIYLTHIQALQVLTGQFAKRAGDSGFLSLFAFSAIELVVVMVAGLVFYALIERTFMIPDWPQRALTQWRRLTAR